MRRRFGFDNGLRRPAGASLRSISAAIPLRAWCNGRRQGVPLYILMSYVIRRVPP